METEIEIELQKRVLVPREQLLLFLLFKKQVNKVEIENLIQGLNIDVDNRNYLLMLAHFGFNVNWDGFPEKTIPQLKGIYRYYQAQNAMMLQKLFIYVQKLNKANIYPLLIKGDAMRLHFAPGVSRMMSDIDLAFEGEEYARAISILKEMGGEFIGEADYSITYKLGQTKIDLHRFIFKNNHEKGSDIWKQVDPIEVNNCHFKVLSPIDMFIHVLDTQSRCIFVGEMPKRRMKWLYDARMILHMIPNTDWTLIAKRAEELHCSYRVHLMMLLFSAYFPEIISKENVKSLFTVDKGYTTWLINAMNYHEMIVSYEKERIVSKDNSITLLVVLLRLKHQFLWKEYKYYAHELKKLKYGMFYFRYVAEHYHVNRPALLYRNYVSRIRLSNLKRN